MFKPQTDDPGVGSNSCVNSDGTPLWLLGAGLVGIALSSPLALPALVFTGAGLAAAGAMANSASKKSEDVAPEPIHTPRKRWVDPVDPDFLD